MDQTTIERLAKSAVDDYFGYSGYVRPFICENDKTPVWDGNLFIYQDKDKLNNSTLLFKVPIQLKGESCKKDKFPEKAYHTVPRTELCHYKCDGGVLFIKVLIIGQEKKIYVCFLTKYRIDKYLEMGKGKSCSIRLEPISANVLEFLKEAKAFHLQKNNTPISPLDLRDKPISIRCVANRYEGESEYAFIVRNQRCLLVKVDGLDGEFYLECGDTKLNSISSEDRMVSINGISYYSIIKREYQSNGVQVMHIGKSLTITVTPQSNGSATLNFSLTLRADNLDELLQELRFIVAIGEYKCITIDSVTKHIPNLDADSELFQRWRETLKLWEDAMVLFDTLHIYEPLDINTMKDEDYSNLRKMIQAVLYNDTLTTSMKEDHLERIKIGNLNIVMLVHIINKKQCKLLSIQDSLVSVCQENDGKLYPLPCYSKIFSEEILQSNIDFTNLLETYKSFVKTNPYLYSKTNEDILFLLSHYDKKGNRVLLNHALVLSEWLNSIEGNSVYKLNYIQTKYRLNGNLTEEDIAILCDISEVDESFINRWAACVLLKDRHRCKRYWDRVSDSDKRMYIHYPIFNLLDMDLKEELSNQVNSQSKIDAEDNNEYVKAC